MASCCTPAMAVLLAAIMLVATSATAEIVTGRSLNTVDALGKDLSFNLPKISTPTIQIPKVEVNTPKVGLPVMEQYKLLLTMKLLQYMLGNLKTPKIDLPSKIAVDIPNLPKLDALKPSDLSSLLLAKSFLSTLNDLSKTDINPKLDLPKVDIIKAPPAPQHPKAAIIDYLQAKLAPPPTSHKAPAPVTGKAALVNSVLDGFGG